MEEEIVKPFRETVEDLYKLHYVTRQYEHYVRINPETLKLFEATKFVYAYFAFNSFYNYDWETSLEEKKLTDYEGKTIEIDGKVRAFGDTDKYKRMSDFIISKIDVADIDEFFRLIIQANPKQPNYERKIQSIIENINSITEDSRIDESMKMNFINSFRELLETRKIKKGDFKKQILYFVYMVRNNIFHGAKNTIQMSENRQRKRLEIYANILIATNEMLFRVLQREKIFEPQQSYRINI